MNEKRKPTYQEIIKLCNKKDKEIERLQRQKEELQVNGLRQETLFKLEIERLNKEIESWIKLINYNEIEDIPQYIEDLEVDNKSLKKENKEINKENKRLNSIINEALRKLRATKDHYKIEDINNAIIYTIRILERSDKVE